MHSRIDRKTLDGIDELQINRSHLPPDAAIGELINISGADGASRDFRIIGMSATEFFLRARPSHQSQAEHWLAVAQRHGPIVQAAKEWSAARADCMTNAVTPGSFSRLALAEAALQSAVNSLMRGDDPARRSDGQAET